MVRFAPTPEVPRSNNSFAGGAERGAARNCDSTGFDKPIRKHLGRHATESVVGGRGAEVHPKQGGCFRIRKLFVVLVTTIEIQVLLAGPIRVIRPPIVALVRAPILAAEGVDVLVLLVEVGARSACLRELNASQ